MTKSEIRKFLDDKKQFFDSASISIIEDRIRLANNITSKEIEHIKFINPNKMLIISITLGLFSIDCIILKKYKKALFKVATLNLFGILYILDIISCKKQVKQYNMSLLTNIS